MQFMLTCECGCLNLLSWRAWFVEVRLDRIVHNARYMWRVQFLCAVIWYKQTMLMKASLN